MSVNPKTMTECLVVRPVKLGDLDELVAMCDEHARYEGAAFHPQGVAAGLQRALWSNPSRLHAWVAVSEHMLIGYATAAPEFSTWAARAYLHMDCLFVREAWRGTGTGTALLAAVVRHACEQDYAEIQWQTPAWNENAARFYRRIGAAEKAKRRYFLHVETTSSQGHSRKRS